MSDVMCPCYNGHNLLFYGLIFEPKQESVDRALIRTCTHGWGLTPLIVDASLNVNEILPMSVSLLKSLISMYKGQKSKREEFEGIQMDKKLRSKLGYYLFCCILE